MSALLVAKLAFSMRIAYILMHCSLLSPVFAVTVPPVASHEIKYF